MAIRDRSTVRILASVLASAALAVAAAGCATNPSASAAGKPATAPAGDLQYFVNGAVSHPGTYSLPDGRKITLKQAVVAAGLPDPVPPDSKVSLICPGAGGAEGVCDSYDLSEVLTTPAGDRELVSGETVVLRLPVVAPPASREEASAPTTRPAEPATRPTTPPTEPATGPATRESEAK